MKKHIGNFLLLTILSLVISNPVLAVEQQRMLRTPNNVNSVEYEKEKMLKRDSSGPSVSSFIDCEAAGFPVMESFPRQCRTSEGKLFIENTKPLNNEKGRSEIPAGKINNFDDCVNYGFPIMESAPARCKTSDGRIFVENPNADRLKINDDRNKLKSELEVKLRNNVKIEDDGKGEIRPTISLDIRSDINRDGRVGFADLRKLMSMFGKCLNKICVGDLNNDLQVNKSDIEVLFKFWTEANEKGMAEKCLALTENESRPCFWNITAQNDDEVKEKREKMKAGFEKMKPELKGNVETEKKIENYLFHMDNTVTKVSEMIARLNEVVTKIEVRIATAEEDGKDLTESKTLIEDVKIKLSTASSDAEEISDQSATVTAENKADFFAKVRKMLDGVKEARKILDEAVIKIKASLI